MISAAFLIAVLAVADTGQANDTARDLLADDKVSFCHDEKYPLTSFEAAWCPPVAPEPNPRCPAFHRACTAPRAELDHVDRLNFNRGVADGSDGGDGGGAGGGGGSSGETRKPADGSDGAGDGTYGGGAGPRKTPDRKPIPREPETEFTMPELGGFAYVLFWVVLGGGLLFLISVIVRNSMRQKDEETADAPSPETPALGPARPGGPSEQVVRDVDLLLEQARAAASAGDFIKAIRHTHAALLHRLDHDGLIRVAPFRTNGDYLADLKPKPDLRASVRDVVRDVEQVQFGTTQPDAGLFDRVFKRVVPIVTRRGETLALVLGFTLLSCTCQPSKSYPYDLSPSGTRIVAELAEAHGYSLPFREQPLTALDVGERDRTVVLLHDAYVDAAAWTHLLRWADAGNVVVLAGQTPPAEIPLGLTTGSVGHVLEVSPGAVDDLGELALVDADETHLVGELGAADVLLTRAGGQPYAVRLARERGAVYVFADDRLFTNGALMLADNPRFLVGFLRGLPSPRVELVDGMLDLGTDGPAETLENTRLTAAILQLLALIALLYLWRGVRFGAPRDPPTRSRRSYTEHIEAVGQHYARARASRHAVRLYAAWALDRLRDKTLTARQPGLYALAQAIAGRTGDDEAKVMQTLVEASSIRDDVDASASLPPRARPQAVAEDLQIMQALARLVRLVGGPR